VNAVQTEHLDQSIACLYDSKFADSLMEVGPESVSVNASSEITIYGYISRYKCLNRPRLQNGRSAGDRQFIFINKRPVNLAKVRKMVNDAYRAYDMGMVPSYVLYLSLSKGLSALHRILRP
jgi:DNA mismatch repair ATPase MutL